MYIMQFYILHFITLDFQGSVNHKVIKKIRKERYVVFRKSMQNCNL